MDEVSADPAGPPDPGGPLPSSGPLDLGGTGARIEALIDASSAHGYVARERSEELVRLVADLYGAGLERLLDVLHEAGRLDAVALDALAGDELVAGLLLVHGLHPYDVTERVAAALDGVRPFLGSHGGDVELLGVEPDGVVRLRLLGSCDGCPSSSVTLKLAVETAVTTAAPEVTAIEVDDAASATGPGAATGGSVIPIESLRSRIDPPARHEYAGADCPAVEVTAARVMSGGGQT